MTEANAFVKDPDAVRITGTPMVKNCAENADKLAAAAPTNRHLKWGRHRRLLASAGFGGLPLLRARTFSTLLDGYLPTVT